jgi:hypothetical protein
MIERCECLDGGHDVGDGVHCMCAGVLPDAKTDEVTDEGFVVVVDCGFSDWFDVRDVRLIGHFSTEEGADAWKQALEARSMTGREGEPLKIRVQPVNYVSANSFKVA